MKLGRNILYPFIGILSLLTLYFILYINKNNYYSSFVTFIYFLFVPGTLLLHIIKIKKLNFSLSLLFSVGFSLAFLIISGILFNGLGPLINISTPLTTNLLLWYFGLLIILLLIGAYLRNNDIKLSIQLNFISLINKWYYIFPPIFVILSILSATLLNNTNNNILAIITIIGISINLLIIVIFYKFFHTSFLSWSLYFYSLSILLLLSLRSNFVSGWDIQSEFAVFQLTKNTEKWAPTIWNGAYNACLSITLLPTILAKFTYFPDDYIYKFFYQIIFAFTPVIIYQFFRKFTIKIVSFIAVIYIISQPLFIQPMTALMRQEIAFLFFMLMSYVMFDSYIVPKVRVLMIFLFGLCVVLSHYSTTYITLLLLTFTYIFTSIFRLTEKISIIESIYSKFRITSSIKFYKYYLNPFFLLFLFLATFIWYGTINNQLGQVQRVAIEGLSRMNELFKSEGTSYESQQAITFLKNRYTTTEDIQSFIKEQLQKNDVDPQRLYQSKSYRDSNVQPVFPLIVKPSIVTPVNRYILIGFELLKQVFKIAVIIGPLYLLVFYFKKHTIPREYIIFCLISVLTIFLVTFHPYIGRQYNLSRLYLQLLFYLGLPTILVTMYILFPFKKFTIQITGILVVLIFVYLLGLPNQFLGGEAKMYFNNYGADYDKFYIHKEEFASAKWLKEHIGSSLLLFVDREAYLRIFREINRGHNPNVLPALIYKDAYVYGSYANIVNKRTTIYNDGSDLLFTFPKKFLEENKNVIYNNGKSAIYR